MPRGCLVHLLVVIVLLFPAPTSADQAAATAAQTAEQREQAMIDALSGSTFIGSFTNVTSDQPLKLHEERYTISKVTKLQENLFLFQARIQYGNKDVSVPIPLVVIWAGDTPVITMTDAPVPGLGRFTARVLVYRDRYAGTWQHGKHGGHLLGRIEKGAPAAGADDDG